MKHEMSLEEHFFGSATVGERGQIVIPAEARKKFDIQPGDKVLVIGHPAGSGVVICKIDAMREIFSSMLSDLEKIESRIAEEPNGE
jgi:AbrB family looped-hinge helix DNA binding protein